MSDEVAAAIARAEALGLIGDRHGIAVSVWAIDDVDLYQPHPWPAARFVAVTVDERWSDRPGTYSAGIMGPRWLDLWLATEQAVAAGGDEQHIFVEGYEPIDEATLDVDLGS